MREDELATAVVEQFETGVDHPEVRLEEPYDHYGTRGVEEVAEERVEEVGSVVNRLGVKPRGFPWFNRTLPRYHRSDSLERCRGSRSGRPRPPMPAVAPSEQREGC